MIRLSKPVLIAILAALALLGLLLLISYCHHDNTAQRQAEQTSASGEAIANAADMAIGTIEDRTITEKDIDHATAVATLQVNAAADPAAVRAAVLDGVCRTPAHTNDPACTVRVPHP